MKINNAKTYYFKRRSESTGSLGNITEIYAEQPESIKAYIYPAGGQVQAQEYGQRLGNMLNMMYNESQITERDGVCVYVKPGQQPDYRVAAPIKHYSDHCEAELERI